jgi:hypothetical protein
MGNMLGGGSGGSPLGGLLGGGGSGGGGGFLQNLLGGLPDPLGLGKMLGITPGAQGAPQQPPGPPGMPPPAGAHFNGGPPASGVSVNPSQMLNSPMSPTGFGIGGPRQ